MGRHEMAIGSLEQETKLLSEDQATGATKALYDEIKAAFGEVPNFFKAQAAINPEWATRNWRRLNRVMAPGALDAKTKELLATVVSMTNQCEYCMLFHTAMAKQLGITDQELAEAREIVQLYASFSSIIDALVIPCDASLKQAAESK